MDSPVRLTQDQVAELNDLVREKRRWFLHHGIDVRLWGMNEDGSFYRILYRGETRPAGPLIEPFLSYGPGAVRFIQGDVNMLVYGQEAP